jgi:ribosomal protein L35AE/L33A
VPQPARGQAASRGLFAKSDFVYEAEKDGYRCLAGTLLRPHRRHGLVYQSYTNATPDREHG